MFVHFDVAPAMTTQLSFVQLQGSAELGKRAMAWKGFGFIAFARPPSTANNNITDCD